MGIINELASPWGALKATLKEFSAKYPNMKIAKMTVWDANGRCEWKTTEAYKNWVGRTQDKLDKLASMVCPTCSGPLGAIGREFCSERCRDKAKTGEAPDE